MSIEPSNFKILFVNPLEDKYKCKACHNLLRDPVQSLCGHRLCRPCADAILKCPKPSCPEDGEEIQVDQIFSDRCATREIAVLECYCPQKASGCGWTGTVSTFNEHQGQCPYEKVKCLNDGCNTEILRCQLARHVQQECVYRGVQCLYCCTPVPEIYLNKHFEKCPKYLIDCDNGCGARDLPRGRVEEHKHLECPLEVKSCRLYQFGCDFEGTKDEIEDHMKDSYNKHLILAVESAENSQFKLQELEQKTAGIQEKNRLLESYIITQDEALGTARETLTTQQIKLNTVEKFLQEQKCILDDMAQNVDKETARETQSLNKSVLELQKKIENLSLKMKSITQQEDDPFSSVGYSRYDDKTRQCDRLEHTLTLHDIQLAQHNLRLELLNACTYDGQFIWKIDNYSQRFSDALSNKTLSLYSPPFYTSRFGYKLCARVYLNGDGSGKATHMSLFISIMKGEYDSILPWPFTHKVTLKLLDQNKSNDISEIFMPDPKSNSFKRPESEMNVASGCPKFCAHSRLQSNGYVKDNVVFIKMMVG